MQQVSAMDWDKVKADLGDLSEAQLGLLLELDKMPVDKLRLVLRFAEWLAKQKVRGEL